MATLKEIANHANVSISTVSRVLNSSSKISKETSEKVLNAYKELSNSNFPNEKNVENLYTIGIYVPSSGDFDNNDPASSLDILGVREIIEKSGSKTIILTHNEKIDKNSLGYKIAENREVDGVIFCDPFINDEYVEKIIEFKIPYLITNGVFLNKNYNYVDYDNFDGGYTAIKYLIELGHKNIGIISGPQNHLVSNNRLEGCIKAFNEYGIKLEPYKVKYGSFSIYDGYDNAKDLIESDLGITAIFAFSDQIAFGAIKAVKDNGFKVPDNISIIGFDNIAIGRFSDPLLTTVRRANKDISSLIVNGLYNLINNNDIKEINIKMKTEIVIRDSCKNL